MMVADMAGAETEPTDDEDRVVGAVDGHGDPDDLQREIVQHRLLTTEPAAKQTMVR